MNNITTAVDLDANFYYTELHLSPWKRCTKTLFLNPSIYWWTSAIFISVQFWPVRNLLPNPFLFRSPIETPNFHFFPLALKSIIRFFYSLLSLFHLSCTLTHFPNFSLYRTPVTLPCTYLLWLSNPNISFSISIDWKKRFCACTIFLCSFGLNSSCFYRPF